MASIAYDSPMEGGKAPVSLHPAFPVVVALWFAALLGLGTLLVPIALLERFVLLTGIASSIPVAAPPLGITARLLIAVAGTVFGALFGWVVARRVAEAHKPTAAARFSGGSATRRPLSAREDLDEEGIAAPIAPTPTKRRSLAMAEDERKSDFLWAAPLPGEAFDNSPAPQPDPELEAVEPEPAWVRAEPEPEVTVADSEALELVELADEPAVADFGPPPEPDRAFEAPAEAAVPPDFAVSDAPVAQFPSADELERRRIERRSGAAARTPSGFERRLYLRRSADEPLPFVAPSLARRTPDNENTVPSTFAVRMNFDAPTAVAIEPQFEEPMAEQVDEPAAPVDWESAPLGELGMIDLVQRLGASLDKRREQAAAEPQPAPTLAPVPEPYMPAPPVDDFEVALDGVEAAEADDAAQAMAAYFNKPDEQQARAAEPVLPVARSWSIDDEQHEADDGSLAASFSLPLGQAWTRAETSDDAIDDSIDVRAEEAEAAPEEDQDDADYGSLLSLRNPFQTPREEFVRVEEPALGADEVEPAVVFPTTPRPFDPPSTLEGQAAAVTAPPAEADEALRRALATLQRMSRGG